MQWLLFCWHIHLEVYQVKEDAIIIKTTISIGYYPMDRERVWPILESVSRHLLCKDPT